MSEKAVFELGRTDLGKKVRYVYDGDSVASGILESVMHFLEPALSYLEIDGVRLSTDDSAAAVTFP